jgi:hypothetical protein
MELKWNSMGKVKHKQHKAAQTVICRKRLRCRRLNSAARKKRAEAYRSPKVTNLPILNDHMRSIANTATSGTLGFINNLEPYAATNVFINNLAQYAAKDVFINNLAQYAAKDVFINNLAQYAAKDVFINNLA